jgi:hypothetical protein
MSISSHIGTVILVIVGMATVIGVIVIGAIEAKREDRENSSTQSNAQQTPSSKKRN